MALKFRKKIILVKPEGTYAVDAVPTGAANAILALDVEVQPLNGEALRRGVVKPYLGQVPALMVGLHSKISFGIEFAGSGVAGTPPKYGPLLRACAMAETAYTGAATIMTGPPRNVGAPTGAFTYAKGAAFTGHLNRTVTLTCTTGGGSGVAQFTVAAPAIGNLAVYNQVGVVMTNAAAFALPNGATITPTVGTAFAVNDAFEIDLTAPRVEYMPVSAGEESATTYLNIDGQLHKMLGCRGNVRASISSNGFPRLNFELIGLFVDPTSSAAPTPDYTGFRDPKPANAANTVLFTIHGYAAKLASLDLDLGNQVRYRGLVNSENVEMTDRAGTGRCVIDAPALTDKNFFTISKAGTRAALQYIHGLTGGDCIQIDAPQAQIEAPQYGNDQGTVTLEMPLGLIPTDTGNDELKLTVK